LKGNLRLAVTVERLFSCGIRKYGHRHTGILNFMHAFYAFTVTMAVQLLPRALIVMMLLLFEKGEVRGIIVSLVVMRGTMDSLLTLLLVI
jgi:hypothetical protein